MACSIASGKLWQNIKTSQGTVVYLAGEGNYGIRQRIASWCIKNNVDSLDHLLVSNKPLDLDAPNSAIKVIEAIRELCDGQINILYVDTLNNHMSGDENSARDTRTMINNCKIIGAALGCTVVFVHHTGLNDSSKGRARGSSAWKGSLDSSILISKAGGSESAGGGVIKISCEKMKDSQEPMPLFGTLAYVPLGWTDEDGDEIKGAAFQLEHNHVEAVKHEPKANTDMKILTKAWFATGAELSADGNPVISRSALGDYLEREGVYGSPGSLRNQLSVKYDKGLLNTLFLSDIIKVNMAGTKIRDVEVINQEFANPMRLSKGNS